MARASTVAWMGMAVGFALGQVSASAQVPTPMDPPAVADQAAPRASTVHTALRTAMDCYRKGDHEKAATLLQQCQAGQDSLTEAERKDLATWVQLNTTALLARQEGARQLAQAEKAVKTGRTQEAALYLKAVTPNQQFLTAADKQKLRQLSDQVKPGGVVEPVGGTKPGQAVVNANDPKSYLTEARAALKRGDVDTAEVLAHEAEKLSGSWSMSWPGHDTPAKVLKECQAARARQAATGALAPATTTATVHNPGTGPIKSMTVTTESEKGAVAADRTATIQDPRAALKHARELCDAGKYDDAEKLAIQCNTHKHVWGVWGDNPDKCLADIRTARTKHDREEAPKVLAEARRLYTQGDLDGARELAHKSDRMYHGNYGLLNMGDRPQKLLDEIQAARARGQVSKPASAPMVAAKDTPKSTTPSVVASAAVSLPAPVTAQSLPLPLPTPPVRPAVDSGTKVRAQALLVEARQLEKQGRLLEARQKARECQELHATFGPDEDRPELALLQIPAQGQKKIEGLVQQAKDQMATAQGDPNRHAQAEYCLIQARQLAVGFGFDTYQIDVSLQQVQQAQGKAVASLPIVTPAAQPGAGANHGLDLLNDARMELRKGETGNARRMAMEAYNGPYGVQDKALEVIRTIEAEETNQKSLAAVRTFDAAMQAYNRQEYGQAMGMLRQIDAHLLPPDRQARLKEIMSGPEAQTGAIAQMGLKQTPAAPVMARQQKPVASTPEAEFANQVKAMQEVKFQALREDGLKARSEASKRWQVGETDRAMEVLQDYQAKVREAGMDADKAALLMRPIDSALQGYRVMKHQRDFEKLQVTEHDAATRGMSQKALAEQAKQKQIKELMAQYNALYHDGKYRDAEAIAMRASDLDPDNDIVRTAILTARMAGNAADSKGLKERKEKVFREGLNNAEDPGTVVDTGKPIALDGERTKIARERKPAQEILGVTTLKSERERDIQRRLKMPVGSLQWKDMPLRAILSDLQGMTGINIVPDEPALNEAGISLDRPVTMNLNDVQLESALNLLLHQAHLTYVIRDEVLNITTENNAQGKRIVKLHPVLDLVIPVENASGETAVSMLRDMSKGEGGNLKLGGATPWLGSGNSMTSGAQVGKSGSMMDQSQGVLQTKPTVSIERPRGTIEETLIKLITQTIAPESWSSVGGHGTIEFFPLGMALVISQTPDIQEQVAELLTALRRLQDQEVAVEVRFITIAESFYERIGLDFNVNIRTNNTKYEPQIVSQQFRPFGFINHFSPSNFVSGLTPAGAGGSASSPGQNFTQDLGIPIRNSSFNMAVPPFGAFPNAPGANGGLSMGLAFLSDIEVFLFMEAAQGDERTNVMQAPKITLFNGATGTITITDSQFFVTNVTVAQIGGQVVFVPNNNPLPTGGVTLAVNAVISADRRFVRMSLNPTLTNLGSANVPLFPITTFITPVFEGGAVGQPVPFTMFLQQPTFNTITLSTTVNVPDGGTVLIGGLKRLSEGRNEFGPPILSKIPYINRLFKNVGYGREAESLLMMVTPRIIINEEEEIRQVPGVAGGPAGS